MAGGWPRRTVEGVLEPIVSFLESAHAVGGVLDEQDYGTLYTATSWDYASAFDRVSPSVCCDVLAMCGVPQHIVRGILNLWTDVRRVLELGGDTAECPIVT
eukprot:7921030-Alexandrium_andersonii.AAC.1